MVAPSKDLEKQVLEIEKKFPEEVVGIRYSVGEDWSGDPAIFFRVLLTDSASRREVIGEVGQRVSRVLSDTVYRDSPDYFAHINYRSKSDQERLKDPEWPSLTIS